MYNLAAQVFEHFDTGCQTSAEEGCRRHCDRYIRYTSGAEVEVKTKNRSFDAVII